MVGSSFSIAGPNVVINTIIADALKQFADKLAMGDVVIIYTDAMAEAVGLGVIKGLKNGTFGPYDPITRAQLALMLAVGVFVLPLLGTSGLVPGPEFLAIAPLALSAALAATGYVISEPKAHIERIHDVFVEARII